MDIEDAINGRKVLRFSYDGALRRVEPHCYGKTRKGEELLLAWQLGGGSGSGEPVGWKTFRVKDMVAVTVTPDSFEGSRDGYKRGENVMAEVFAQL